MDGFDMVTREFENRHNPELTGELDNPVREPYPGEHLSDREILLELHEFMGNINAMLVHVGPALEGISKSPIGKMLGIK